MTDDPKDLRTAVARLETELQLLRERVAVLERARVPAAAEDRPAAAPARDLEAHLGTYWLPRVGILALITGIAFLVVYRFRELGATTAIVLGYAVGAALAGAGVALAKRHSVLGQVLVGGGLAVAYFVTFALHFVPAVRVVESEPLALALLAAMVVGIIVVAQRLRSETVAGIALFLGLHTGFVGDLGTFTLLSSLLLAAGALFFLVRNRWVIVPTSTLVAVYVTHLVWAQERDALVFGAPGGALTTSLGFLAAYHLLFTIALVARPAALSQRVLLAFPILNWIGAGVLGALAVLPFGASRIAALLAVLALVQVAAGVASWREGGSRELARTYLLLGGVAAFFALPAQWSGHALAGGWLALAGALVVTARVRVAPGLSVLGALAMAAAAVVVGIEGTSAWWLVGVAAAVVGIDRLQPDFGVETRTLVRLAAAVSAGGMLLRCSALVAPAGLVTAAWVAAAFALFGIGFLLHEAWYRYAALGALAFAVARLFFFDLAGLSPDARIVTFLVIGTLLLAVSYVYSRVRRRRDPDTPAE